MAGSGDGLEDPSARPGFPVEAPGADRRAFVGRGGGLVGFWAFGKGLFGLFFWGMMLKSGEMFMFWLGV